MQTKKFILALSFVFLLGLLFTGCDNLDINDTGKYVLTIQREGIGNITEPGGIGEYEFDKNAVVTLKVEPVGGYLFADWQGPNGAEVVETEKANEWKITMDSNKTIEAVFIESLDSTTGNSMKVVAAGTTSKDNGNLTLDYDIEMARLEVNNEVYLFFLNDAGVAPDGSYKGKKLIETYRNGIIYEKGDNKFSYNGKESDFDHFLNSPVLGVTWYGAVAYCNWLSEQVGLNKAYDLNSWELKDAPENLEGYRLPTEDEWEYTARGGVKGKSTIYAGSDNIDEVAWYMGNCSRVHTIGGKQANELDLYDMSGNAMEWTNTSYNTSYGTDRVVRGGGWRLPEFYSKVDYRYYYSPSRTYQWLGFRLTRTKNPGN